MAILSSSGLAYLDLERRLRDEIIHREFDIGDKLPTVLEMAERYGVGKDTVIRSVKALVKEGVLESRRGVGITIKELPQRLDVKQKSILSIYKLPGDSAPGITRAITEAMPGWQFFETCLDGEKSDNYSDAFLDEFFRAHAYEGYLLCSVPKQVKEYAQRKRLSALVVGELEEDVNLPNICNDERQKFYQGAKFLLENGYSKIAFIQIVEKAPGDFDREIGVMEAYSESNQNKEIMKPRVVEIDGSDPEGSKEIFREFLSSTDFPTGVVSTFDLATCWLLQLALEMGIAIPEQLGIITDGTSDLPTITHPQITSLRSNDIKLGFGISKMLTSLIRGYELDNPHTRIPFEPPYVLCRQTTKEKQ